MEFMETVRLVIGIFIAYLCVYSIIDRICKCFENVAIAKAYGEFTKGEKREEIIQSFKNKVKG